MSEYNYVVLINSTTNYFALQPRVIKLVQL